MNKISNKYLTFFVCLALTVSTLAVFRQVCRHQFITFDDDWYIYNNSSIKTGLTWDNIVWVFTHDQGGNYHPLTAMSHMLDCNLYGLDAGGHHFTNLLFHLANAVLLFLIFKSMTANLWASAFIAAVFALHPLHVESVAWASERKDVLSAFFGLLTMAAYLGYVRKSALAWYLLTLLLFAMGLLAKPMLVTLPFLLLLLDYWPLNRMGTESGPAIRNAGRLIVEKIPFLALAAVLSTITFLTQKSTGIVQDVSEYPFVWRVGNAAAAYLTYIVKMFWPVNLAVFYPHPKGSLSIWQVGLTFFLLVCITAASVWQLRKRPYFAVGWFWFVISLFPVIGLVQVGLQAWADRYTYMSYTGLLIIVAWGTPEFFARSRLRYKKPILALFAAVSISIFAVVAWFQVGYWQNNEKLYAHAAKVVKDNWWAYHNLGREYAKQGKLNQAAEQFTKALRIYPDNVNIKNDLAETFFKQGQIEQAIELYREFLPPLPDDVNLSSGANAELLKQRRFANVFSFFTEAQINLGIALMQQGKSDQAIKHFAVAIQIKPELVLMLRDIAGSLLEQGKPADAEKLYQQILQILPEDLDVHNNLGIALAQQRKFDDALQQFDKLVTIEPNSADYQCNLGFAFFCAGRLEEAAPHFSQAIRLEPNLLNAHYYMGAVFHLQNRLNEAVQEFRRVLQLKPDRVDVMNMLARIISVNKDAGFYDPNEAVSLAEKACQASNYQQPEFLDTLSIAYSAAGRFQEAVETADKAIKLAEASGRMELAQEIQAHLNLYKARQPYVESPAKTPTDTGKPDSNAAP